ncbi:MAG: glucose 1-dehydrogenase [Ramlibacter sp.]|nr:glucose 1-dehydrogenase [Ramlibacter sp.]
MNDSNPVAASGRLAGKVAVVTGGASGFGEAIAARFAREGARVVVADLHGANAEAVAARLRAEGLAARACQVDVANGDTMQRLVEFTVDAFDQLDVFVNNAGIAQRYVPCDTVSEQEYDHLFDVNMKSLYWCAVKAVPAMRARGGVILCTASTSAIRPRPDIAWYCASKGAAIVAAKALALELAPQRIRVCCLSPVAANTPLLASALSAYGDEGEQARVRAAFAANIPLGRLCDVQDMANAALFLASDEASFLTGVCLEVDGGRCI